MVSKKGRGKSRRANPVKKLSEAAKKSTVYLVCVSLIATSLLGSFAFAADDTSVSSEEVETEIYSMGLDTLCDALENAVRNGETVDEDEFEFSGSSAGEYEKLFDTKDGLLYEINPVLDEEGDSLTLRTFVRLQKSNIESGLGETAEDDEGDTAKNVDSFDEYNVTENEQIIFLLVNNTDDEVSARIHVTSSEKVYETKEITVPGNKNSKNITLDTFESENEVEYFVINDKNENVETAVLRVESANDADEGEDSSDTEEMDEEVAEVAENEEDSVSADSEIFSGNSRTAGSLLKAVAESASDVSVSAHNDDCTPMKGKLYDAVSLNGTTAVAFVTDMSDFGAYGIALLDATQVLEGSGSVEVYEKDSDSETPEYILTVTDAPTNTEINLDSPHITLTDQDGDEIEGIVLAGNLTYVPNDGEETPVAYLMLDDDVENDDDEPKYVLTPYGENDEAMDMDSGKLVITLGDLNVVYIWKIQTNTLCYLEESGTYQTEIIEAVQASEPILCDLENYAEGQTVDLATLAGVSEGDFYYGSITGILSLTSCSQAVIQDGKLLPLDESGNPVSGVSIYFAYDELYSFDVAVDSVVNEHTEDNGDAYLWVGDTFYIDQYHSQGVYLTGYTNNATETEDCGIWPMLGRTRESLINAGTYGFERWMDQDLSTWEKVKAYDGVTGNDLTKSASGKDNGDKNYGIVGPFKFTDGETDVTESTVRVTGRIGDEFTASEVFGTGDIYMIRKDSDYHDEWYNLGSHASDNGKRSWFYWINDFYVLNNYQDLLEYVQIVKDVNTGEIHLLADEIGEDGDGSLIDVWDLEGIYTKRDAAVKTYMASHEEELTEMGVGFSEYLGWLDHIQLRMFTTVETIINGVEYNGTLSLMTRSYIPTVTYDITYTDLNGEIQNYSGSETVTKQNEQECNPVEFSFYINPDEAFDADNGDGVKTPF